MSSEESSEEQPTLDVVRDADPGQLQHFVTEIKSAEQQVGEHILSALQHEGTVAVLTTVVVASDGKQRVVSAALKPELLNEVQKILVQAQQEREEEQPCVGFHCLVKPRTRPTEETATDSTEGDVSPDAPSP